MKKLITILTIMIVLVGAVFAANTPEAQRANGTAAIDITAKVPEQIPQFQIKITSSTDVVAAAEDNVNLGQWGDYDDNASTPDTLQAGALDKATAALSAASVNKLIGNGVTAADVEVAFEINQVANANLTAAYDITITATDLDIVALSDGTVFTSSSEGFDATKHRFTVDTTASTTKGSTPTIAVGTASGTAGLTLLVSTNTLTASYTGAAQVAATKQLGTFSVIWNKNTAAVSGDYKATVTMTVTTHN